MPADNTDTPSLVKRKSPVSPDPEVIDGVLARVALGEPLAPILREPGMPHYTAFYDWCRADAELGLAYARARAAGYDHIAITARATARGLGESTKDVQRDRLIIETDLKLLKCWDPKRYGDKVALSGDADNPIVVEDKGSELAVELLGLLRSRKKQMQIEGKLAANKPGEGPARITGEVSPKPKAKP